MPPTNMCNPATERTRKLLLSQHTLWSPGIPPVVALWGLPIIPCVALGGNVRVRELTEVLRREDAGNVEGVWAWTKPDDALTTGERGPGIRAATRYGGLLIADVEARKAGNGWSGKDAGADAAKGLLLARTVGAVSSHGYVLRAPRPALIAMASAGCIAVPQLFDRDASAVPRTFVRTSVRMYQDIGFVDVCPLIGLAAALAGGVQYLRRMEEACHELEVNFHVWAYGSTLEATGPVQKWVRSLGTPATPSRTNSDRTPEVEAS